MTRKLIHPALLKLLQIQAQTRCKKIHAAVRSPRRKMLVTLALMLGFVWLGQALLGIMFRESADPTKLAVWIPLGFFGYTAWHVIKTICCEPVEPFEWTPAEKEMLCGAPLSRMQLVAYRFLAIVGSAVLKSACFSFLMIPDLAILPAGFVGMFLGLMIVEILRIIIQITCYALSKQVLIVVRLIICAAILLWIGSAFLECLRQAQADRELASPGSFLFAYSLLEALIGQLTTTGRWLLWPFSSSCNVILAESIDVSLFGNLLLSSMLILAGFVAMLFIDNVARIMHCRRETDFLSRRRFEASAPAETQNTTSFPELRTNEATGFGSSPRKNNQFHVPIKLHGAGSIAWRQFLGAYHYRSVLAVSLGVPTLLCCLPLLADHGQFQMMLHIVAGLVFYSFLLLPPALMLDFRRDAQRLDVLKSLPISPLAVTLGQLAAPVFLCALYHWSVLGIATLVGSISWLQMILAGVLLIPVCVLIFALENLIFMVAPYRRNQEGFDMFLRTILTFTAKGILFALGLAVTLGWALTCKNIGGHYEDANLISGLLFGLGVWTLTMLAAVFTIAGLASLYRRFDPSQDAPAVS